MKQIDRRRWLSSTAASSLSSTLFAPTAWATVMGRQGRPRAATGPSAPVTALVVVPSGKEILAGSQAGIRVCSLPRLEVQREIPIDFDQITRLRFADGGKRLVVAGGNPAEIGVVEVLRWPSGERIARYEDHTDVVWDVDEREGWLAAASLDRSVSIRGSGASVVKLSGHSRSVTGAVWLAAGQECVTCGLDQSVRVWQRVGKTWKAVRALNQHRGAVLSMSLRPSLEEKRLPEVMTCGADKTIRLWQPTIGRLMRFVRLERAIPVSGCWSGDGNLFAVACDDGVARWIDPRLSQVVGEDRIGARSLSSLVMLASGQAVVGDHGGVLRFTAKPR